MYISLLWHSATSLCPERTSISFATPEIRLPWPAASMDASISKLNESPKIAPSAGTWSLVSAGVVSSVCSKVSPATMPVGRPEAYSTRATFSAAPGSMANSMGGGTEPPAPAGPMSPRSPLMRPRSCGVAGTSSW